MQETTANTTMIVSNINAIQENVTDIQNLSEKEQKESQDIMARARKLRDSTSASNDKAMEMYERSEVVLNADDYKGVDYIPVKHTQR